MSNIKYKNIVEHFQKNDSVIHSYIHLIKKRALKKSNDYFCSLCREIVGQQLSGKAAATIYARFLLLFPNKNPSPEKINGFSLEDLRKSGMSWAKAKYIKNLAEQITTNNISLDSLDNLSDEEVIIELTKIKGIGPWTAEMFLMFSLARENIFSYGDLGLKNAIKKIYGFKKDPTKKQVEKIVSRWSPYKTYACLILWESLKVK